MARFPTDEKGILAQARRTNTGLQNNPTTFPNPPEAPADVKKDIDAYDAKDAEIQAAQALLTRLFEEKSEIVQRVARKTKDNIAYGEIVAKGDNAILEEISWSTRAAPKELQKPGQCRNFEIISQGDGWFVVDWKEPKDGGKPASYIVLRSEDGGQNWVEVKTAVVSEATLVNQPSGKKLIYQVVAINRAGQGMPSNIVTISF